MGKVYFRLILVVTLTSFLNVTVFSESVGQVTLFFTGEVGGTFEPCGCKAGPTGGLARRLGYSDEFSDQHDGAVVHVDAGNYFFPPGPASRQVNDLMLESLTEIPLSVLNLAPEDLFFWDELAQRKFERTQIISTNLVPRNASRASPDRFAIVKISPSATGLDRPLKIGFLGISDPRLVKPNSGFRALDPLKAIIEVKDSVLEEADLLVILAAVSRESGTLPSDHVLAQIANQHPEVSAIITTERRFVLHQPQMVNNAVVLSSVERGRYLGRLTLKIDSQGALLEFNPEFIELSEAVPENQSLLRKQARLSSRVGLN